MKLLYNWHPSQYIPWNNSLLEKKLLGQSEESNLEPIGE